VSVSYWVLAAMLTQPDGKAIEADVATGGALAAEAAEDEIIVTATRSGSPIEELPISVSIADEEEIAAQLRQNRNILTGLEAIVPGLNIQPSEERGSCLTRVRGRAVSFQLNGIPVNEDLRAGSCTGPFTISPFAHRPVRRRLARRHHQSDHQARADRRACHRRHRADQLQHGAGRGHLDDGPLCGRRPAGGRFRLLCRSCSYGRRARA
jgi:hypothetical protein